MTWTDTTPACRHQDAELFFPAQGWHANGHYGRRWREQVEEAKAVCRRCPLSTACLSLALELEAGLSEPMRHGVWGGTTPAERVALEGRRAS